MEQNSNGIQFQDPHGNTTAEFIMTGLVDDTTHWINNFIQAIHGQQSITELYQATQQTAQWWEQLLHATGGKLELSKCFYYPVIWNFDEEGCPSLNLEQDENNVTITSSENDKKVTITKKIPTQSHKTLGIMENPSGDYSDELQNITDKALKWKMSISNQYLMRAECKLFHQNFFIPSL